MRRRVFNAKDKNLISTVEKKFDSDVPDGFVYLGHDLEKIEIALAKWKAGSKSFILGEFCFCHGAGILVIFNGDIDF